MKVSRLPRQNAINAAGFQRSASAPVNFPRAELLLGVSALLALVATTIVGTLGALIFILATLVFATIRPGETLRDLVKFAPLLLLPILAMISTLWSPAPQGTLRLAMQLLLTFVAAIIVARRVSLDRFLLILFVGYAFICLLIVPTIPASLANGQPLGSAFLGSKNQVGFAAHMLIALALAVAVQPQQRPIARLSTLVALPMGLVILLLSQSAGARTSLAITLLTFVPILLLGKFKLPWRVAIMIAVLVALAIALVFLPDIQTAWGDFRTNVLKKDATLTGRTQLWEAAARISAENPLLGQGYSSFWRRGNIDAEGLWRWAGIGSRNGFNFHNAFVEIRVELGWVGVVLLITTCAAIGVAAVVRQITRPSISMACLISLLAVQYVRSYTENGLVAPFSLWTVLWIATAVYAFAPSGSGKSVAQRTTRLAMTPRSRFRPRRV